MKEKNKVFIHIKDRGFVINLDRYDAIEINKTPDNKFFDLQAVRYEGQLKIGTLIERFDREADALHLQNVIVERLNYSDHVIALQRDYLGKINNLGNQGQIPKNL